MPAELEFALLGTLVVRRCGVAVAVPAGRQRALLAMLLLNANRVVPAGELIEALWGADPPVSVRPSLHNYVKRLRKTLGDAGHQRISTHSHGYMVSVEPGALDVARFEALARAGLANARAGRWPEAATGLREALSLWRGEALADVESDGLRARQGARLAELRLQAVEARLEADLHLGRHSEVIPELRQLTTAHPLRERPHALLMRALERDGQRAAALAAYRAVREVLVAELGVEPGSELRELQRQILGGGDGADAPRLRQLTGRTAGPAAPGAPLDQPGASRITRTPLEEFVRRLRAVRLHAGTPSYRRLAAMTRYCASTLARAASGRSLPSLEVTLAFVTACGGDPGEWQAFWHATALQLGLLAPALADPAAAVACLPASVWDFTGRDEVLDHVRGLICSASGHSRPVVAITGPGGVGKTSLALRVAHEVTAEFPDGQVFVTAKDHQGTPVSPGQLVSRTLIALGVDGSVIPPDEHSRSAMYQRLLSGRRVLLVFDDIVEPAQARPLIPGDPGSAMLLTSRLALPGLEAVQLVRLERFSQAEAVEFEERLVGATRVAAEPAAAAEIAQACGLLPLAIRIAGARLAARPHWALSDMAARLADERRRLDELTAGDVDVRACLAVSYQQLDLPSQRAFRLLGVPGMPEIPAWAAAAVLDVSEREATDRIDVLAMAGLLEPGTAPDRFRFHDLVRLYAGEMARRVEGEQGIAAVVERTLNRCAGLAEGASRLLNGGVRSTGGSCHLPEDLISDPLAWLAREEAGLVALVSQGCRAGAAGLGARLALALAAFFELGTRYDSWRQVAAALRAAGGSDARARAFAFYTDGVIASELDAQPRLAIELLTTAARQLDDLGEHRVRGYADVYLSTNYHSLRDYPKAASSARRALRAFEELDDQQGIGYARLALGIAATDAEALADLTLAMEQFRRAGHTQGEALTTQVLGSSLSTLGRHDEAVAAYREALATIGPALSPADEAALKLSAAHALTRQGHAMEALPWAEQAMVTFNEIGHLYMQTRASHAIAMIELSTGRHAEAVARLEDAAGIYGELGDAFSHRRALRDLAAARQAMAGEGNAVP